MEWGKLLFLIGAILLAVLLYRQVKGNPQVFSRENMGRSLYTLGILALLLICFIGFLVMLVRVG